MLRWPRRSPLRLEANAAWYEASSKHFIIYANDSPRRLLAFASELERFDRAVRFVMNYDDPPVGDGNRLAVYVLPSVNAVQKLAGKEAGDILGFYQPRAEGCAAFVPKTTGRAEEAGIARATLTVVAHSPHSERAGDVARRLISAIDAGKGRAALQELGPPSTRASVRR